jgi:hypothetical protein
MPAALQITMIVWQKLSSAREVLVEQELGDVLMAGAHGDGYGIKLLPSNELQYVLYRQADRTAVAHSMCKQLSAEAVCWKL